MDYGRGLGLGATRRAAHQDRAHRLVSQDLVLHREWNLDARFTRGCNAFSRADRRPCTVISQARKRGANDPQPVQPAGIANHRVLLKRQSMGFVGLHSESQ